MWQVNPELQKKIRRLMFLKYKKHKRIANLSLACLFIYSLLVFLILTRFCTIDFKLGEFAKVCFFILSILLLIFMLSSSLDDVSKLLVSPLYENKSWILSIRNIFALSIAFSVAMMVAFVCFYDASILNLFLLFLFMSIWFFVLCLVNKKTIPRNNILFIYFLFYFIFLWPVVESVIDDIPVIAKIWKIIFSISPFLLLLFRSSFTDFLWSGYLIRRWFKIKDSEVWNCPWCHWYIMKKPIRFCPHCGCDTWALDSKSLVHVCKNCGSFVKIKELDFPNFCPHCGLWFKFKRPRTYS